MKELKFIEKRKENSRLNELLMPTTMSKSEMKKMYGGTSTGTCFCEAGCDAPAYTCNKVVTCPSQGVAVCANNFFV